MDQTFRDLCAKHNLTCVSIDYDIKRGNFSVFLHMPYGEVLHGYGDTVDAAVSSAFAWLALRNRADTARHSGEAA